MNATSLILSAVLAVALSASPAFAGDFGDQCITNAQCEQKLDPGQNVGPDYCCCFGFCDLCIFCFNCLFSINYSEDGCEESKSAVGLNAYLQDELYTVSATQQLPCAEAMTCRMDAESNQDVCPEDQMKKLSLKLGLDEDTGSILNVLENRTIGPDVCYGGPSNQGVEESWFNCYFSYWTLDNLKDWPEVLANDNPEDLLMMQKYSYLVYYEDDACTDLASVIPSVNGKTLNIPSVSNTELSCNRQAMCAIDPNSAVCEAVRDADAENAQITLETRLDETTGEVNVYECDSSNVAAGEEKCALQTPSGCGKSSIYSNCYFRYLSGPTLALNPRFLVGEVEVDGEDDMGGGSEMETPSNSTDTDMGDMDGMGPGDVIEQLGACVVPRCSQRSRQGYHRYRVHPGCPFIA